MVMALRLLSLQLLASACNALSDGGSDAVSELQAWLREQGARGVDNVAYVSVQKGSVSTRGLAVTRNFSKGETIFMVPRNLSMYAGNPLLGPLPKLKGLADDDEGLVVYLAHERLLGEKSIWWKHMRTFPTEADYRRSHPLHATPELLQKFFFLPVAQRAKEDQDWLSEKYERLGVQKVGISREVFRWAYVVSLTRAFGYFEYFLPLSDLMNGDLEPSIEMYCDDTTDDYYPCNYDEVVAGRDLNIGDELTISYSALRNDRNLLEFGFLYQNSPKPLPALDSLVCSSKAVQEALAINEDEQLPLVRSLQALTREQCGSASRRGKGRAHADEL
eukprot:TRINITY_DN9173_c0_g1_i1.p1 TRINITY_DN9173_c0_g1~~TRINITY_DN9173_c0_g1_i1.p1  ORF type:complete len:332 (-),score=32.90 TRINITY_DN9173_c0_g1_i1:203-1198(-)